MAHARRGAKMLLNIRMDEGVFFFSFGLPEISLCTELVMRERKEGRKYHSCLVFVFFVITHESHMSLGSPLNETGPQGNAAAAAVNGLARRSLSFFFVFA